MKILSTRKNLKAILLLTLGLAWTAMAQQQSPLVMQDDEELEPVSEDETLTEIRFDYVNAFLAGFRSAETIPSATNCTKYLESSIMIYNDTRQGWDNETLTRDWGTSEYVFDTTEWISYSLAPSSHYCFMSTLEVYSWVLVKNDQFDSLGDVFAAWLQNLLGNVITFNSLYKKIEEAEEAGNFREVYYWYGRFFTLFINFDPIEEDNIDDLDGLDDDSFYTKLFAKADAFGQGMQAAQEQVYASKQSQGEEVRMLRSASING